jgi:PhnB protein
MSAEVKAIPDGYGALTPYLCVDGASAAIDFYTEVFGAKELARIGGPGGRVGHAQLNINGSLLLIADEFPDMGVNTPGRLGGSPVTIFLYVEDVDSTFGKALAAGATELKPVEDRFYGDRAGKLQDPFGHIWHIATHKEDLPIEEIERRAAELFG